MHTFDHTVAVEHCSLKPENKVRLKELILKYVPFIDDVDISTDSEDHFTIAFKFSSNISDTLAVVDEINTKLNNWLASTTKQITSL